MKIEDYYQKGRYAGTFIQDRIFYYENRLDIFEKALIPFWKHNASSKILDAGCGDGGLMKLMVEKWGIDGYGTDISKKGIRLAKKAGIKAKVTDLSKKIPFGDNFFDVVIACELIEHLVNPDIFLSECRRVLKKNGFLVITTPNLSFWFNRIIFLLGIYPLFLNGSTEINVGLKQLAPFASGQVEGHLHVYNLAAIVDLFKYHHFTVSKIKGIPLSYGAKRFPMLTKIYQFIDRQCAKVPGLSADMLIVAKKQTL